MRRVNEDEGIRGEGWLKISLGQSRKQFCIRLNPEVYQAFKLLCDASGHMKVNEAIEDQGKAEVEKKISFFGKV